MPKRRQPQRRRSSLIMTPLRRVILEEVTRLRTHPTADEIYQVVRRRMPRASLSSVYRNLNLMCDEGLIQRADIAQVHARFDGVTQPHYHVRCVRCGRM
ncbi:MAG: transcriptional repressor, partial [Armatimonadota bacterium]